ncbi:MAG: RNA polymerase sigma factor [Miltoncostaeaceae bacterium]
MTSAADAADRARADDISGRLRRRDPRAIEELYREMASRVLGYLVGVLRDRGAAEDVLQEVFAEAWRRGRSYDPARGSAEAWIMTMAKSRAIDHLRKRVPEPREPALDQEDPATRADDLHERWRIAALLDRLPADEAALVRMRFHAGYSQSQIADATGTPLGTVKMRMASAMKSLRVMMVEEEAA